MSVGLASGAEPDPEKSQRKRLAENLRWAVRHGEANDYYYLYGLHRTDGPDADDFLSVVEMMDILRRQMQNGDVQGVAGILKDKYLFSLVAESLGYRSPRVIAFLDSDDVTWLSPRQALSYQALAHECGPVDGFVKPLRGRQAVGAFALKVEGGRLAVDGYDVTPSEVQGRVTDRAILQERIVQHPALSALHEPSINTVRLVTVLRGGVATPLAAALRIGVGGASVDNWSAGGLVVDVDVEGGRLRGEGLLKPSDHSLLRTPSISRHPDTGVALDGYELPGIGEGVALACRLHQDLSHLTSVGWDLAFTPDGPTVVEGNAFWNGAMFMALNSDFKARYLAAICSSAH